MSQEKKEIKPWERDLGTEAAFLEQHALEYTEDMPEPDAKEGLARLLQRIDEMEKGKKGHGRLRWKALAVLAAVFVLLFAVGLGTVGKRIYTPEAVVEHEDGEVVVRVNNDEWIESEVEEEEIYQEIEDRLGIKSLRLGYKPQGMRIYKVDILEETGEAKIYFVYNEKTFFVYINRDFSGVEGYIKADGGEEVIDTAENFILNKQINIIKDKNEEGQIFLHSEISYENMFYTIAGNIKLEEFLKIIEEIYKKDA